MRNTQYPLICTFANYAIMAVLALPVYLIVHIDPKTGICMGSDWADQPIGRLYAISAPFLLFTILPVLLLVVFNILTIIKMR